MSQQIDNTTVSAASVSPFESFDGFFDGNDLLFEDPLSLQLHEPLVPAPNTVSQFDGGRTGTVAFYHHLVRRLPITWALRLSQTAFQVTTICLIL